MTRMKDGLFDACGLIENLKAILGDSQVKGLPNLQKMLLVAQGLDALREGLRKEEGHDEDHPAGRQDL